MFYHHIIHWTLKIWGNMLNFLDAFEAVNSAEQPCPNLVSNADIEECSRSIETVGVKVSQLTEQEDPEQLNGFQPPFIPFFTPVLFMPLHLLRRHIHTVLVRHHFKQHFNMRACIF